MGLAPCIAYLALCLCVWYSKQLLGAHRLRWGVYRSCRLSAPWSDSSSADSSQGAFDCRFVGSGCFDGAPGLRTCVTLPAIATTESERFSGGSGEAKVYSDLGKSPADYLHSAKEIARQAGFTQGSPMIDLTGRSPGLIYALMADSVGLAWVIGGYPGSNQLVIDGLRQVPCGQLAAA